jgi:DNA-binding beta-propeller fold protein YncE
MWFIAALLAMCGCATPEASQTKSEAQLVWPSLPDPPRIAYVQSITGPADVGIKSSAGTRALRWIFGSSKGAESLVKPFGVATDENGNLLITDTGANAVSCYNRAKRTWQRWDRIGTNRFIAPVAMAKRGDMIFIADSGRPAVIAFSENGKSSFTITNQLQRPAGLALAGEQLLVADSARHAVVIFDLGGRHLSEFGRRGAGPGEFNFPTHIAAGADGHVFVTDSMNARVQVFDRNGRFESQLGSAGDAPGHFGRPKGVAVDSHGHVYVIDGLFDVVQIFDRDGRLLLNFGGSGSKPGEFWLANGIAIGRENDIYVADAYNHRVQVFKYIGGEQ